MRRKVRYHNRDLQEMKLLIKNVNVLFYFLSRHPTGKRYYYSILTK